MKAPISVVLICAALCLPIQAEDSYPEVGWKPDGRFPVLTHKNFVHPMRAVRYYLAFHHRSQVMNHLCFVGYYQKPSPRSPEGTAIAYVYWKEGNRLIFWPGTMAETPDYSLTIQRTIWVGTKIPWKEKTRCTETILWHVPSGSQSLPIAMPMVTRSR